MDTYGYDYEPQGGSSKFLRVDKAVGSSVIVRLCSKPKVTSSYWLKTQDGNKSYPWPEDESTLPLDDNGEKPRRIETFFWIVLQRVAGKDESGNPKVVSVPKIFQASSSVYRQIKGLATELDEIGNTTWGDPQGYDIKITREKEQGAGSFAVRPLPKSVRPLNEEEQKLLDDAKLTLDNIGNGRGRDTATFGSASRSDLESVDNDQVDLEDADKLGF